VRLSARHVYVGDPHSFGVGYDRFTWHRAPTSLTIDVGPGLQRDSLLRILISKRFAHDMQVTSIDPKPLTRADTAGYVMYGFLRADRRQPVHIVFVLKPRTHGTRRGVVGLRDVTSLPVRQLVLP